MSDRCRAALAREHRCPLTHGHSGDHVAGFDTPDGLPPIGHPSWAVATDRCLSIAQVLQEHVTFSETDPATWSPETPPVGYAWRDVKQYLPGELHLFAPDGRDLSAAYWAILPNTACCPVCSGPTR